MEILEPEHSEVIEWIVAKHDEQKASLIKAEALLKAMPKLDETNALVARLRRSVDYYTSLLHVVKTGFSNTLPRLADGYIPEPIGNSKYSEFLYSSEELDEDDGSYEDNGEKENNSLEDGKRLAPKDFIKQDFKDMTQEEALLKILESYNRQMAIEEVAMLLYDTDSDEDFRRARDSIAATLRSGAEAGKWQKVSRGVFASNSAIVLPFQNR